MKRSKEENAKQEKNIDDGRVIVDMDVEGFSWHRGKKQDRKKRENVDQPTAKETRALILAAYKAYLPYLLIVLAVFAIVFLIGYLYLN